MSAKKLLGRLSCLAGHHRWTCAAAEGVKPTQAQLDTDIAGFYDYATMYCARCGRVSQLSKAAVSPHYIDRARAVVATKEAS